MSVEQRERDIDVCCSLPVYIFPFGCLGVSSKIVLAFVQMYFVRCTLQSPKCGETGDTAANDCDAQI